MTDPLTSIYSDLFDELLACVNKRKKIAQTKFASELMFHLQNMSKNSVSKLFAESSLQYDPGLIDPLVRLGTVQRIQTDSDNRYALTFKGIAIAIQNRYGMNLDDQYAAFLGMLNEKYAIKTVKMSWREKVASVSLLMMLSTSEASAIRLNNASNTAVFSEVFNEIMTILQQFNIIKRNVKLRKVSRGETPVAGLMSRLNDLAPKTNYYYRNITQDSGYFFDIEREGQLDITRLFLLLNRIIDRYDPQCDYDALNRALSTICQTYYPQFIRRSINPSSALYMIRGLREYMQSKVYNLASEL